MVRNAFTGGEFVSKVSSVKGPIADDVLARKWSGKTVVRDGFSPSVDPGISFDGDPGLTDQSQAKDCDVNVIVDRFMKTGVLPQFQGSPIYGDFSEVASYQDALGVVAVAEEQFSGLTAKVRARFDNDPAKFLAFVNDPKNMRELVSLGLASEHPKDEVVEAIKGLREDFKKAGPAKPASKQDA